MSTDRDTLVRLWPRGYQADSVMDFVDWDNGRFTVDNDHPFLAAADAVGHQHLPVTVWSTFELEWELDQIDIGRCRTTFHCLPRRAVLRRRLVPDYYLVELWLGAEQKEIGPQ